MSRMGLKGAMTLVALISLGCSAMQSGRTRTTAPPAGPVVANTSERGVVPAGTTLTIRANEPIEAKDAGRTFSAQVAQDIVDETDQVLVPKGSPAELIVMQVDNGGAVGTPTMQLAIRSVTVNGHRYDVSTYGLSQRGEEGIGANQKTAETVGGGALLGTLIGAAAGGGKGAAIGAIAGAAAGATAQVVTRGEEIKVPAETVLTFRLDNQLRLEGYAS